ncbi:LysR family transcriptional regulator [Serratia fonticola]|jgi:DNA-binding transcriptional LysR family regulator|uniref:LysR family transcriptional regulator n=1 Tax=Serratia fonticola TaxID=47917 RepID=UPI003AAD7142|nr:LysR family transcriptional regulator [Serratia fonticola]
MDLYRYTENLSLFIDIARNGSFSSVARRHGVNPSSIMRKINRLEDVMRIKLFIRSPRGLMLTDAGEALYLRSIKILDALSDMYSEIGSMNTGLKGILRVSCLPTFAKLHIFPWLSEFKKNFPDIDLALDLTERLTNPSIERLDAVIRIGPLKDSALYATHIVDQYWIACASPFYLQNHGHPSGLDELEGHHLLDKFQDPYSICWRRVIYQDPERKHHIYLRCNDFDALRISAVHGLGIAFLPNWVVGTDINAGRLVKVFDDPQRQTQEIHLLRAEPKISPRLTVFLQALHKHLANELGKP